MTIVTNENFEQVLSARITEGIANNSIENILRIVINICFQNDKTIIEVLGDGPSENYACAGNLRPLSITRLIEKVREQCILSKTAFSDKNGSFRFINEVGNIMLTLNIFAKDLSVNIEEFLDIVELLRKYYENEAFEQAKKEEILENKPLDVRQMNKADLLILFGRLNEDELRSLLGFLPPERLNMINKTSITESGSLGRK